MLCLFDFDGVLVDSLAFYEELVRQCLEKIGVFILRDSKDYLDLFEGNFYESLRKRGVDVEIFNDEVRKRAAGADYGRITPVPGMAAVLPALRRQGATNVIISSNSSGAIEAVLEKSGWSGYFEAVLSADFMLEKVGKILYARDRWNSNGAPVYYIGDTSGDIREARAGGVRTVAVTWGWHTEDRLRSAKPDLVVHSPSDLILLAGDNRR